MFLMTPDVIRRKLIKLTSYLEELHPISKYSFVEYLDNYFIYRTAERIIQLIVDTAVDINSHILLIENIEPAVDYFTSFLKLSELKIIPEEFAKMIAPSTGLRNRIVHEYDNIENILVYNSIAKSINFFKQYLYYIEKYLEQK